MARPWKFSAPEISHDPQPLEWAQKWQHVRASHSRCTKPQSSPQNKHSRQTKMINISLTIEGVNEKRFYLSVFCWIHSVKLCLLLGSTIWQEALLQDVVRMCNILKNLFCGATGGDRCGSTGERENCKHLLFEQMNPLVKCQLCCEQCVTSIKLTLTPNNP